MSLCLMVIDDGREDYLERCLASHVPDAAFTVKVSDPDHVLGFAGAIQRGWEQVLATGAEWVFHLESDFTLDERVPLQRMIALLEALPHLAQVSLKRQAVNEREKAAGGIVEADPDDFTDRDGWTEHRRYFTTNPSVYSTRLCERGWPQQAHSEGVFTHQVLADDLSFAIWGQKSDPPKVTHIGERRTGTGY